MQMFDKPFHVGIVAQAFPTGDYHVLIARVLVDHNQGWVRGIGGMIFVPRFFI